MVKSAHELTYDSWNRRVTRKTERRSVNALMANALAGIVLQVALFVQFAFGAWRNTAVSADISAALLISIGIALLALLVVPERVAKAYRFLLHHLGRRFFLAIAVTVLTLVYLLLLPAARTVGRRSAFRRHPQLASWVQGAPWQGSGSWVDKTMTHESINSRGGATALRAVSFFIAQRNWFLVVLSLLLVVVASVIMLSNSPVAAPFIYTLF